MTPPAAAAPARRRAQTAGLLRQLLSPRGRLRRRGFWLTGLAFVVFLVVIIYVSAPLAQFFAGAAVRSARATAARIAPLLLAAELLLAWPATAVMVKRGHDRGYGAARTLVVWGVFLGLGLLAPVLPLAPRLFVQVAILAYLVADYGFTPGVRGPNAYGDDPRQVAVA